MDIAIIVALQEEFPVKINPFPEYTFYTGIGKINAAIATTRIVERYDPKLIINIGTAGGPSWMARYIPNTNMFITNILKDGNHIGSLKDLRKVYGRGLKWGKQPFLDTDMHIIFGPEDDISKLTSYERIQENF